LGSDLLNEGKTEHGLEVKSVNTSFVSVFLGKLMF